ncbi:hypothetical protein Tco_0299575, partial [Tanacetum coccineum]
TMTKVIKEEFEKLKSVKISDVLITCNTSLEIFIEEFNRMSIMEDDLFTCEVEIDEEEYKDDWIYEWNKDMSWVHERPWTENGVWKESTPVTYHCKPFNYKSGCSEWPTCSWKDDGYCNGGNLSGAYIDGNTLRYQDLEWYEALKDCKLKEEDLKNKAIMGGMIDEDDESKSENEMEHKDEERCEVFYDHERPICYIRRFEMVKYSFRDDEEYVAIKENKYDDLTNTRKEAIHAYHEIFRMMDEGWMVSQYGVFQFMDTAYWSHQDGVTRFYDGVDGAAYYM